MPVPVRRKTAAGETAIAIKILCEFDGIAFQLIQAGRSGKFELAGSKNFQLNLRRTG